MTSAALRPSQLTDGVRAVLEQAYVVGAVIKIPGALDRATYLAVDTALQALGGKWNRKAGGHVFAEPDPLVKLRQLLGDGLVPARNALSFFATPPAVIETMLAMVRGKVQRDGGLGFDFLEPSAGEGAIALAVSERYPSAQIGCVEIDPERAARLSQRFFDSALEHNVWPADFLSWSDRTIEAGYDLILMNPPFAAVGDTATWIAHVQKAHGHLADGGQLVTVAPQGYRHRTDRRHTAFRAWADEFMVADADLPPDAFAPSGTGVNTILIHLERRDR